jgi:hypothetical protein
MAGSGQSVVGEHPNPPLWPSVFLWFVVRISLGPPNYTLWFGMGCGMYLVL